MVPFAHATTVSLTTCCKFVGLQRMTVPEKPGFDFLAMLYPHVLKYKWSFDPLLLWYPVPELPKSLVWIGIGLVAAIWLSTAFLQVPSHGKLVKAFDPAAHKWLVNSNWIRTIVWTARGALVTWMLVRVLSK